MVKRLFVASAALAIAFVWVGAAAALDPDVLCRKNIGLAVRKLTEQAVKHKALCYRRQMLGQVPGTVDCNDVEILTFNGEVRVAE